MMAFSDDFLRNFILESNMIEGIHGVETYHVDALKHVLEVGSLSVRDVANYVNAISSAPLRDKVGMNVQVGNHIAPRGGPDIRDGLEILLQDLELRALTPFKFYCHYESLHPFMDGNGRSGRALWLRAMNHWRLDASQGFLRTFHYQTLEAHD